MIIGQLIFIVLLELLFFLFTPFPGFYAQEAEVVIVNWLWLHLYKILF